MASFLQKIFSKQKENDKTAPESICPYCKNEFIKFLNEERQRIELLKEEQQMLEHKSKLTYIG